MKQIFEKSVNFTSTSIFPLNVIYVSQSTIGHTYFTHHDRKKEYNNESLQNHCGGSFGSVFASHV